MSLQEDALVNALNKWMEEHGSPERGGPKDVDGSRRVIVSLALSADSLQYIITAQALLANLPLLKHVVRAIPKPVTMRTLAQAFARVDLESHMKLSQQFIPQRRKSWYADEANKLHKLLSFARRRWRRFRDGTLAGREGHPLSELLDAFDEAYDDDMTEFSTATSATSADSQLTSVDTSCEIPPYPADHDHHDDFDECDDCISVSSSASNHASDHDPWSEVVIPPYPYNAKDFKEPMNLDPKPAAEPMNLDPEPVPKKRRKSSSPEALPTPQSRTSLLSFLAQARLLDDAPRKKLVLKTLEPSDSVRCFFKIERKTNRFWRIQDAGVNLAQVTPRMTNVSGAGLLRDLATYGVAKEGLEFIKRSGLLPPPDSD